MIRLPGIRSTAKATSASSTTISATRNTLRDRGGSCGNSELVSDGCSRCSPGAAPKLRGRNHSGPSPGRAFR